ncbi:hypothetical protein XENTR_v10018066 [Xenopus tropicalis]|nr:CST complex subunit STN1 isoform X1 [Xenopus tropicalis]KAE8590436.1 hypothetical protein XENTR_v10018066 [Xenopus tropicalis]
MAALVVPVRKVGVRQEGYTRLRPFQRTLDGSTGQTVRSFWMQPASLEETPSLLWGLDPIFLAFAKLYIKDILELKESQQVPGIFFYRGHPIKQVDVLGTVVFVREKENFYSYGVDDSTGVISCTCWKSTAPTEVSSPGTSARHVSSSSKDLDVMMRELYKEESKKAKLDIGDTIRVRGSIKVFRDQREIVASVFYKVEDPKLDIQMARMFDLPYMYRNVYDKPFAIPEHLKDSSAGQTDHHIVTQSHLIMLLSEKVKVFLMENKIHNFYQRELESVDSLIAIASRPVSDFKTIESMESSNSKQIRSIFKEAIQLLLKEGYIFQKDQNREVYQVTDQDKDLHKLTLNIIKEDCRRQKHAEKGCHFLHILTCVRLSVGSSVSEAVLRRVIDTLEGNSDIVSTMENYYTAF